MSSETRWALLKERARDGKRCSHGCPGGNRCCCNAAVPHTLHICKDEDCYCHSRERYEIIRAARLGIQDYVEQEEC